MTTDQEVSTIRQVISGRVSYPILPHALKEFGIYHISGLPSIFLIDRDGVIRWFHSGYATGEEAKIELEVLKLLGEKR